MSDDLEKEVNDLKEEVEEIKNDVGWLRRTMDHVLDILRSVGGHYRRAGKIDREGGEGEDKSE